jgi:hypothetical protein
MSTCALANLPDDFAMSSVTNRFGNGSISSNLSVQLDEYSRTGRLSRSLPVARGGMLHRLLGAGDSSVLTRITPDDDEDEGDFVDQPPVYVNATVGSMSISPKNKPPGRLAETLHSNSAQIPLPDLSVSPLLTASSYQTMEKHYDQDTGECTTGSLLRE